MTVKQTVPKYKIEFWAFNVLQWLYVSNDIIRMYLVDYYENPAKPKKKISRIVVFQRTK